MNQIHIELNSIYATVMQNGTIIEENLFSKKEKPYFHKTMKLLVEEGTFQKIEQGKYQLVEVSGLYNYGIRLFWKGKKSKANACFEKCHQIDPKYRDASLQLMLIALRGKDYERAYQTLDEMGISQMEKEQCDNTLYLYLLNILMPCKDNLYDKVQSIAVSDIIPKEETNPKEIEMRKQIMRSQFSYAMRLLNDLRKVERNNSMAYVVLKELLSQILDNELKFRQQITDLTSQSKYNELLSILEGKQKQRRLANYEEEVYLLVKAIEQVTETQTIPPIGVTKTDSFHHALIGANFFLANEMYKKYKEGKEHSQDAIGLLLAKLIEIITDIEKSHMQSEESKKNAEERREIPLAEPCNLENTIKELEGLEEMAYYLQTMNLPLVQSAKQVGLFGENLLLVKLIYARDYYARGDYDAGDLLIHEVQISAIRSEKITYLLDNYFKDFLTERESSSAYTKKRKIGK